MQFDDGLIKDIASDDDVGFASSDDEGERPKRASSTVSTSAGASSRDQGGADDVEAGGDGRSGFLEDFASATAAGAARDRQYMDFSGEMTSRIVQSTGWSMQGALASTARDDSFTSSLQAKLEYQRKAMRERADARAAKIAAKVAQATAASGSDDDKENKDNADEGSSDGGDSSDSDSDSDSDDGSAPAAAESSKAPSSQNGNLQFSSSGPSDARRELVAQPKKGRKAKEEAARAAARGDKPGANEGGGVTDELADRADELADRAASAASLFGGLRATDAKSFEELRLSRTVLRALADMGYSRPTPIQARAIPHALAGRDVMGSAVTGSGKTAAFLLPTIERIVLHKGAAATRVLVLLPTRELASQCHEVCKQICKHTHIRCALAVGGLSVKVQEVELRSRPEVVIATPGRIVDLLRNSRSVDCDDLEVLVLDEADRLLDMGFAAELESLLSMLPTERQTMLFSATLDDRIGVLAKLSLQHPVRVSADPLFDMSERLTQEFVRCRRAGTGQEEDPEREAFVLALLRRSFKEGRAIVFCGRKRQAHRLAVILGLCGESVTELHGDMSQRQRLESLEMLRGGQARVLVATDLASRGIDVPAVETVINMDFPKDLTTYVHRVGRTARAGRRGVAVTLAGTGLGEKTLMREIVRRAGKNVLSRSVAASAVERCRVKIARLEPDIKAVFSLEWQEKSLRLADMEARKAENMILHEAEIMSRPKRSWIQSKQERQDVLEAKLERSRKKIEALAKGGQGSKELLLGRAGAGGEDAVGATAGAGASDDATDEQKSNREKKKEKWAEILAAREAFQNKQVHRLSRKKRRRQEALGEIEEMERERRDRASEARSSNGGDTETRDGGGDRGEGKRRKVERTNFDKATETGQAVYAKRAKKKLRDAKNAMGMSAGAAEHSLEKQRKREAKRAQRGVTGGERRKSTGVHADLVGSAPSDDWQGTLGRRRKAPDSSASTHDAPQQRQGAVLRKGGKPGRKSFKSKAKHKRR